MVLLSFLLMWPECSGMTLFYFVGLYFVQFDIHFCLHAVAWSSSGSSECSLNAEIEVKYLILLVSILLLHV